VPCCPRTVPICQGLSLPPLKVELLLAIARQGSITESLRRCYAAVFRSHLVGVQMPNASAVSRSDSPRSASPSDQPSGHRGAPAEVRQPPRGRLR
jgi:hypothetical protein